MSSIFTNRNPKFKHESIDIGDFTYGLPKILSWGESAHLKIGRFCSISDDVEIYLGGEHRTDWVTTYPFHSLFMNPIDGHPRTKGDVIIGNDVWIGRGATILSGVVIGDGAVIGAQAVVAKHVLPYAIVAGNPIRYIKFRFTDDQIVELLKIKWWDWDHKKIIKYMPLFESTDIKKFIAKVQND